MNNEEKRVIELSKECVLAILENVQGSSKELKKQLIKEIEEDKENKALITFLTAYKNLFSNAIQMLGGANE